MNVDIRELWIYVTTVRKANLQKVSKSIELSSSTLSRDLSNLSSRLEFDLYRKDKKSFISTEKGLLFYDLARLLIVILKRMESLSDSGGISIGLSREKYSVPLTDALQTFIEQKPDLRTEIHYGNRRDLRNALMNEMIDFMVCADYEYTDDSFDTISLDIDYHVAVPAGHPFASKAYISHYELQHTSLVYPVELSDICEDLFGDTLNYSVVTNSLLLSLAMTANGRGCSIVPDTLSSAFKSDRITIVPLYPKVTEHIVIVARKNIRPNSPAYEFWQLLNKLVKPAE